MQDLRRRLFAFESSASQKDFRFHGRDQRQMIRYCARFRNPENSATGQQAKRNNYRRTEPSRLTYPS
jgi:hypothetical protein